MSIATDMLDLYIQAEKDVLGGKSVEFNGRRLTLENLAEIRAGRVEWERRVAAERQPAGAPRLGGLSFSVARMD
ncbi:hypothetical protein N8I74_11045 [Chitiniphilus purpureus]|uniref:Primosomal replication protein PriB/PriC domain protein n=1 Tax=Chitiniphilus purpureus TaxID=2981137 RepID=A0ABY6DPL8_9NEIS|nr:hypothetical protein [Chitiniphilus sp. CD1]UXY13858.1 hypothetical protein N8I74_11045 [Chitiniphilus sp. CD1]